MGRPYDPDNETLLEWGLRYMNELPEHKRFECEARLPSWLPGGYCPECGGPLLIDADRTLGVCPRCKILCNNWFDEMEE